MNRLCLTGMVVLFAGCQRDQTTGLRSGSSAVVSAVAENDDGPPPHYPTGRDTYSVGVFTGTGRHKLNCTTTSGGGRQCDGYLRSAVDKTLLDVRLEIPAGAGPFPLIALIHGYAGSKTSSGDIASRLLADGYAILRYSTRGFGDSWGQVNLADLHAEIGDLHSMIAQVVDNPDYSLNPDAVAVTGASYGGGHSWLALVEPTFQTPKKNTVHIRAVVPIAPWTDLLYSLLPNGRPNNSLDGIGGLKTSFVNGLYASGVRFTPERPYPNYPVYFMLWHEHINLTEPNPIDPIWQQVANGLTLGRSIWWQQAFWTSVDQNRVPIFQVQGFTDDLFPVPEAKRMLLAIQSLAPDYPITSYFGDIGHPRAHNQPAEVSYVLDLIEPWLAWYLKGEGGAPQGGIYASRTDEPFNTDPEHFIHVSSWTLLWKDILTVPTEGLPKTLINPVTFAAGGVRWDPFVDYAGEPLHPYLSPPPESDVATNSLFFFEFTPPGGLTVAGQPSVLLDAVVAGHRVQLNVRLLDVDGPTKRLITRGTLTLDAGASAEIGARQIEIPTYGNFWRVPSGHTIRLEISNADSPYITPSREPSVTVINQATLRIPYR